MLFVCLAHFSGIYLYRDGVSALANNLALVGRIASPTFVVVSGLVAGFLAVTNRGEFPHLRRKLLDRGIFLLVVVHAILTLATPSGRMDPVAAYRASFITDALAIAIMVGPWLVSAISAVARSFAGVTLFALNWWAIINWDPTGPGLTAIKHYFVGVTNTADGLPTYVFPVIPWLAVYVLGTVLGGWLGRRYAARDTLSAHRLLAQIGAIGILIAIALRGATWLLRTKGPDFVTLHQNVFLVLSPYTKFPPGPAYLAFFGGTGLLLLATVLEAERRGKLSLVMRQLRQLGRASLFVFVLQFYLYANVLKALHLPYTIFWPLIFLFSLILLAQAAALWNGIEGNRFLTVGLTWALERLGPRKSKDWRPELTRATSCIRAD